MDVSRNKKKMFLFHYLILWKLAQWEHVLKACFPQSFLSFALSLYLTSTCEAGDHPKGLFMWEKKIHFLIMSFNSFYLKAVFLGMLNE